jgi:hypothetical protein
MWKWYTSKKEKGDFYRHRLSYNITLYHIMNLFMIKRYYPQAFSFTKMKCGICRKWLSGYINVNPYAAPETFCDCGRQTEHDETKIHWLPTIPYCQICMCELPCKCPPQFRCGSTVVDAATLPNVKYTGKPVCEECGCVHSDIDCEGWRLYCSKQCILCEGKKTPWQDDCYYCDDCEQAAYNSKQK